MRQMTEKEIKRKILDALTKRKVGNTIRPSEAFPPSQRSNKNLMSQVKEVALKMAKTKVIEVVQRGEPINLKNPKGAIRLRLPLSKVPFEYVGIDFSKRPELYRVARGEQGVLSVEPYKSDLLPLWRFKDIDAAKTSSEALFKKFLSFRRAKDFVGMDMARKFIQMGVTRSRRYANHRSGRKYVGAVPKYMKGRSGAHGREVAPLEVDPIKAKCAEIFRAKLDLVNSDKSYLEMKSEWQRKYG